VDYLVLEVGRVGGLVEARRIAALAEVYHTAVVPIGSGGSVSLSAALQLAAVVPNLSLVEVRPGLAAVDGGMVSLDGRPGFAAAPHALEEGL
jgi:L-alanine-DL-glutamate epimerase-like enolase superfamily enzyme